MASARHLTSLGTAVSGAALALATGVAVVPTAQAAQRCVGPPGLSGIEQYCEMVPGAGGKRPSAGEPGSRGWRRRLWGDAVPGSVRRRLGRAGRDGAAVLALADGSSPSTTGGRRSAGAAGGGGAGAGAADGGGAARDASGSGADGSGPGGAGSSGDRGGVPSGDPAFVDALKSSADSGSSGAPLPWILLGVALLLGALAWIRRRPVA